MKSTTKEQVYELICEYTVLFSRNKTLLGSAVQIAEQIFVSRSLVSLYLNELFREGLLIKINSRPVYFLDKKTLSKIFNVYIHDSVFEFVDDLMDLIDTKLLNKGSFIKAIGYDGSLNYCIHQMQSAVKYPGNDLPILLLGNTGCGKTFLSELLAQFCIDEGLIDHSSILVFSPSKTEERLSIFEKLFGYYNRANHSWCSGLIEQCSHGMLILKELHRYDEMTLSSLINYFKNGYYVLGTKGEQHKSSARIVMTSLSNELIENWIVKELPIVCRIPDFHERPVTEREHVIIDRFQQEQKITKKNIFISKKVFQCLVDHKYLSNFKELQAVIKSLCVASYREEEDALSIKAYQLPEPFLTYDLKNQEDFDDTSILIDEFNIEYPQNSMYIYFDLLLSLYDKARREPAQDENLFMNECRDRMNDYYDYLIYDRNSLNSRLNAYENVLGLIADEFLNQYQIFLSTTCINVLSKIVYYLSHDNGQATNWQFQNLDKALSLKTYFKEHYNHSYYYAELFVDRIKNVLDIDFDIVNEMFIFLNIYFNNQQLDELKYDCIILAHGYSTASSISDTVNRLMGKRVFIGIDMPINITFEETVNTVKRYLKRIGGNKDLILLIDMGSLESLNSSLLDAENVNIGMIDNVNLKLALNIAAKTCEGSELEEIVKSCSKNNVCNYRLHLVPRNQNAIVFTNEPGETATERVIRLLKESLPKTVGMSIVSYSYESLLLNKRQASVFQNYNIVLIVGLTKIDGLNIPFVSLEEIVAFSDFDLITKSFKEYMNAEEMKIFTENLIRNFSLSNILDNITILNATKLYDQIQHSLSMLENHYNIIIPNKTKVGLYIHFACLIERLVLRHGVETASKAAFQDKGQKQFIKTVQSCFQRTCDYYKIRIPDHEILYLYEHLKGVIPV